MARGSNRTGSGSISPAKQNTPAARRIFFASPPAETMLRGGQCPPVKRQPFGSRGKQALGEHALPWTAGGNPPSHNPKCCRPDQSRPGQGRWSWCLGYAHQGNQERVLLWLVERGGAGYEYPYPATMMTMVRSELEA